MPFDDLLGAAPRAETSSAIRARVEAARERQRSRQNGSSNAAVPVKAMRDHCALDDHARSVLAAAVGRLHLSARAHDRILRVARTVADLAAADRISATHVAEAVGYRSLDRGLTD